MLIDPCPLPEEVDELRALEASHISGLCRLPRKERNDKKNP